MSLLDDFLARRKMRRELEAHAHHLAKQIKDSAADISPKHLHTGYEFGPVQQWPFNRQRGVTRGRLSNGMTSRGLAD